MNQELLKTKISFLKNWMDWLTPDKFLWVSPCRCWDGLIYNFFKGTTGEELGGLFSPSCLAQHKHKIEELLELGITQNELIHFEKLVAFWLGDYSQSSGPYNDNRSFNNYNNGIRYFTDYIAHLESQLGTITILPELLKEPTDEVLDVQKIEV